VASVAATAEGIALRCAEAAPALIPRSLRTPVLHRLARQPAADPNAEPSAASSAKVTALAVFAPSARADALRLLSQRRVPKALVPYALSAAIAAHDNATIDALSAGLPDAVGGGATAMADGRWDLVQGHAQVAPRAHVERWVVDAVRAGHYRVAVALGATLERRLPRDVARALAEAADGVAIITGALESLTYQARPEPHEVVPGSVLFAVAQSLPHRNGGYATRTHGLVRAVAAEGWRVRVLTRLGFPEDTWARGSGKSAEPVDVVDGVEYHRAGSGPARLPLAPHTLAFASVVEEHARAHGAAVVHASSFPSTALGAALAANAMGVPFVYEVRALEALYRASDDSTFVGTDAYAAMLASELAVCQRATAVLAITDEIAAILVRLGVDPAVITTINNAVDPAAFVPAAPDAALARRLGVEGRTVIGYAGAMVRYEGLDLLLDALDILAGRRDDMALVALGDGPEYAALAARAARSAYPVVLPGRLPHAEVAAHLELAQICPFPRRSLPITEAVAPMKPFEAMALGKAVVVSDVAALRELVDDGVTGLVARADDAVALAAALERLLDDPALRKRVGDAARAHVVNTATWASRGRAVAAVYSGVGGAVSS